MGDHSHYVEVSHRVVQHVDLWRAKTLFRGAEIAQHEHWVNLFPKARPTGTNKMGSIVLSPAPLFFHQKVA